MPEHKPIYRFSLSEAIRNEESALWRESLKESCDCARAIERAIGENYHDNRLDDCAKTIIERYGFNRVNWVLANTVQQKAEDGRISSANKAWAKGFSIPNDDVRWHFTVESHPGLTDIFLNQVRKAWQALGLFEGKHCTRDEDYRGKVVVIRPDVLKDEYLGCHPCVCTSSLKMKTSDVILRFLPTTGHEYQTVHLTGED